MISRWEHLIYQLGGHGEIIAYVIKGGRIEAGRRKDTTWNEPLQDSPQLIGLYAFEFQFELRFLEVSYDLWCNVTNVHIM